MGGLLGVCKEPSVFVDIFHLARSSLLFDIGRAPDNHARITVFLGLNIRCVVDSAPGSLICPLDFPQDHLIEVQVLDAQVLRCVSTRTMKPKLV